MGRRALAVAASIAVLAAGIGAWLALDRSPDGGASAAAPAAPDSARPRTAQPSEAERDAPAPPARTEPIREEARPAGVGRLAAPEGDLGSLLRWLADPRSTPLPEAVANANGFAARFARVAPERIAPAGAHMKELREIASDGAVLTFEPGVWKLDRLAAQDGSMPRDLTLAGTGMDQTLLLLDGVRAQGDLERLALRDCTVFTAGKPLVDAPRGLASVVLERVRAIGFDSGLESAPVLRARGLAVLARDCEFAGGFGPAPGSGSIFESKGGALLARVERCRFSAVRFALASWPPRSSVRFEACTFESAVDDPAEALARLPGVTLGSSRIALLASGTRPPALDLDVHFPRWRQRQR